MDVIDDDFDEDEDVDVSTPLDMNILKVAKMQRAEETNEAIQMSLFNERKEDKRYPDKTIGKQVATFDDDDVDDYEVINWSV